MDDEARLEMAKRFELLAPKQKDSVLLAIQTAMKEMSRALVEFMIPITDMAISAYRSLPALLEDWHETISIMDRCLRKMDSDYARRGRWDEGFGPRCTQCLREYGDLDTECYPADPDSLLPDAHCMDQDAA